MLKRLACNMSVPETDVGGGSLLIDSPTTSQPTNTTNNPPVNYYSYRVTLPHTNYPALQEIFNRHCKTYLCGFHNAHGDEHDVEGAEHFHVLMLDIDSKAVEAIRLAVSRKFERKGNALHSGKFMDNSVTKGIQYISHDAHVTYKWRGTQWQHWIDISPDWDHSLKGKKEPEKRKREADPMLTYSNILWRALEHRREHKIASVDLAVTLEHMTRTTNWIPSADMMRRGLDPLHHSIFKYRAGGRVGKTPDWWTPKTI